MEKTFMDVIRMMLPMSKWHKDILEQISLYLKKEQIKDLKFLLKTKKIGAVTTATNISKDLTNYSTYTQFQVLSENHEVEPFLKDINRIVKEKSRKKSFETFSRVAEDKLTKYIAPNILGFAEIKETSLLTLFAKERLHTLLIGDPGTGKTDIIRSIQRLSPISSFGLGSGTSGAGLSVTMKGKEMELGLLPMAHEGICCIDELNLMQKTDRAALYSAMEKGFVSYDKKGVHKTVKAEARVLATANPVGDKFVGKSLSILKEQLPFDSALLSRFHLVYVIREPDAKKLAEIASNIVKNKSIKLREEDLEYIKAYVEFALEMDVEFDKKFDKLVASFIEETKNNEKHYVVEVGPRMVHGVMRLAQARARLNLRKKTNEDDIKEAIRLMKDSLHVGGILRP